MTNITLLQLILQPALITQILSRENIFRQHIFTALQKAKMILWILFNHKVSS